MKWKGNVHVNSVSWLYSENGGSQKKKLKIKLIDWALYRINSASTYILIRPFT